MKFSKIAILTLALSILVFANESNNTQELKKEGVKYISPTNILFSNFNEKKKVR